MASRYNERTDLLWKSQESKDKVPTLLKLYAYSRRII